MAASVDNNMISYLNINATSFMDHLPKLRCLNLCRNNLTYMYDFRNDYVGKIGLLKNPWHCGPQISWMGEDNNAFERDLTCATPICMRGRSISAMGEYNTPLNPLRVNFFQMEHKIYIYILCHSSTLIGHRWLKSFLK